MLTNDSKGSSKVSTVRISKPHFRSFRLKIIRFLAPLIHLTGGLRNPMEGGGARMKYTRSNLTHSRKSFVATQTRSASSEGFEPAILFVYSRIAANRIIDAEAL